MSTDPTQGVLTITGSDGSGGAGIQADIRVLYELDTTPLTVITAITVQNTLGIQHTYDVPSSVIAAQIQAITNDLSPQTVKIGMVKTVEAMQTLQEILLRNNFGSVVYAPVIQSIRGDRLMGSTLQTQVINGLLPHCTLVVIRREDAEYLTGQSLKTEAQLRQAAQDIIQRGAGSVLIHAAIQEKDGRRSDLFMQAEDALTHYHHWAQNPEEDQPRHGLINALSTAIASFFAKGYTRQQAVTAAYEYISHRWSRYNLPSGRGRLLWDAFINAVSQTHATKSDVKYYADKLNVTPGYLAQVTRKVAGKTPKTIIDETIMTGVKVQLLSSSRTIQQIAYDYGFSSQAHLTRFVRKHTGHTPTQFRKTKP